MSFWDLLADNAEYRHDDHINFHLGLPILLNNGFNTKGILTGGSTKLMAS